MVRLLGRGWRDALGGLAASAKREVLIAAPYIKEAEAGWFCDQLRPGVKVLTLANLDSNAIRTSALDVAALRRLADASPSSRVVSLSHLHAKVFVADETVALVTSANITRPGLDRNLEYGVLLDEPALARRVRSDMLAHVRLGSEIDTTEFAALQPLETELREQHAAYEASAAPDARRRLDEVLRRAHQKFASTQVGDRSRNATFGEGVLMALERGPLPTREIAEVVRGLFPALCDDSQELVINGERYGKAWKHSVRNAQQHLKRRGAVVYDGIAKEWRLAGQSAGVDR